jgi:hypothetical protein
MKTMMAVAACALPAGTAQAGPQGIQPYEQGPLAGTPPPSVDPGIFLHAESVRPQIRFGAGDLVEWVIILAVLLLPTWIALGRRHPHAGAIFLVNAFTGWFGVGFVAALIWSLWKKPTRPGRL